jgi:hypothetical protein
MVATTSAFETRTGAALRNPRKCTHKYTEEVPEVVSQLWAKKSLQRQALLALRKAGA